MNTVVQHHEHQPLTKRAESMVSRIDNNLIGTTHKKSTSNSSILIAAIGIQLLLCTVASAAQACTGTLDRIESSVAHALRDIVDRNLITTTQLKVPTEGYTLSDTPRALRVAHSQVEHHFYAQSPELWFFHLPPPRCNTRDITLAIL